MNHSLSESIGIVSDIEKIKIDMSERIRALGLRPVVLQQGNDIFHELEEQSGIDALLLDLDDPNLNYAALLPLLHEKYPLLKVVVLSTDCNPQRVRMAMHNGVFDFISKPVAAADFEQSIQRTIAAAKELKQNVTDYEDLLAIEHELDVARNIQSSILPKNKCVPVGYTHEISGRNQAAQRVGGDFFDYFTLDEHRLGFVIGDVASKGIPAAIFMAVSRTLFKTIANKGSDPATCLKELNRVLAKESDPSMFIAIFYGILDMVSGEIIYANGGHTYPLLIRSDGSMNILDQAGDLVLGVVEDAEYRLFRERLLPGDIFFTATDGLTELTDPHGKPVSDYFLKRNLITNRLQSPDHILDTIYESIKQIHPDQQSLSDDITCLLLKFQK